jgi:hypothetical protein
MSLQSINPANGDVLTTYEEMKPEDVRGTMPHSCHGGTPALMIGLNSCVGKGNCYAKMHANTRV